MSCSAFEVIDDQNDVDPEVELNFTMLETVSSVELSILHGLPPLAEFCANAISSSTDDDNNLYTTMLRDDNIFNMLTNLRQSPDEQPVSEQPICEQPVSEQPACEKPVSEQQDFRSSDHDRSSDSNPAGPNSKALVVCNQSSDEPGPPVVLQLDPNTESGTLVIGANQLVATPNSSNSGGGETNEQASNPLPIQNPPVPMAEPNELEIDEAFQNVFSGFSQTSEKDLIVKLDADTLQTCLNNLRNFPLLICNNCLELYQHIPPFQVHIQTCCDPPRFELKQKMDQAAMDQLARSMWKEVFIKELKKQPAAQKFDEGFVHIELDQLWNVDPSPVMLKCREIFIRAAVCIVSRRWVSNAVANDLHRVMKMNQTKAKKRTKSESDTDQPFVEASFSSITKTEKPQSEPKKRRGRKAKSTPKKTETDIAVRSLVNELDEPNMSLRYHFTPETPVSDHGIDVTPRVTDIRIGSFTTPTSDSGIEFTPEMDSVIERFVREEKTSDVDLIEEAGKDFENLDTASDEWENGNGNDNTEEVLSENEYVVGKIRDRRLLYSVENGIPLDEDYEYLVSWEGFGDEEDTWEPYEHLKHCTLKLKEFHERLKNQALRNRRGKRI